MKTQCLSGYLVVGLSDAIDSATFSTLANQLVKASNEQRPTYGIIVDLRDADLPDVSGLVALLMAYWRDTSLDSSLRLAAPDHSIREALFSAKLDLLAPVYPGVRAAIDAGPDAE